MTWAASFIISIDYRKEPESHALSFKDKTSLFAYLLKIYHF